MRAPHLLALAALALPGCGEQPQANKAAVFDAQQSTASTAALPAFGGVVTDQAELIPPAREAHLTARLTDVQRKSGRQFLVVTVPSLNGEPIEAFGQRLGTAWAVGGKDKYDGVLLIVAPNEKKVRIATGQGLRPLFTDEMARDIIDRDLLPHFRKGEMIEGIEAGVDAISQGLMRAGQRTREAA